MGNTIGTFTGASSYSPYTCWWFNPSTMCNMLYWHFFMHIFIFIQWWESGLTTLLVERVKQFTHTHTYRKTHWFFEFVSFGIAPKISARCTVFVGPCLPLRLAHLTVNKCQSGGVIKYRPDESGFCKPATSLCLCVGGFYSWESLWRSSEHSSEKM